jgi:uncharacterized protein YjbI with pentapeptide repeats
VILAALLAVLALPPPHYCTGCNFAGLQLGGANFESGIYVGTNFAGTALKRASFRGAKLVAANFQGADLTAASFDGAECTACNFENAKFDGATFSGVRMVAANFKGFAATVAITELRALLAGCVVCNFQAASLSGLDLSSLSLIGIDFSQADLRATKFDRSVLCYDAIDEAQLITKCDLLKGARVDGASFLNIQRCADPSDARTCTEVDAAALRRYSGSSLAGATTQ